MIHQNKTNDIIKILTIIKLEQSNIPTLFCAMQMEKNSIGPMGTKRRSSVSQSAGEIQKEYETELLSIMNI